jgi:hypothetical protein
MTPVPVKHVQQRAGEQERKRKELHHVRAMLRPQEVSGDQNESREYPAAGAIPAARAFAGVLLVM